MEENGSTKKSIKIIITAGIIELCVLLGVGIAVCGFYSSQSISTKVNSVINQNGQAQSINSEDMKKELAIDTAYPGVTINGKDISGKTKDQAAAMFASEVTPNVDISLSVEGTDYPIDPAVFKSTSNLSSVIDQAFNYNKTSTNTDETQAIAERYQTMVQLAKTPVNFDAAYSIDTEGVDSAVRSILEPLEVKPVNAKATTFDTVQLAFVIDDYVAGLDVDIDSAIAAVKAAVDAKQYDKTITVAAVVTEPEVSKKDLAEKLGLVSSFTTQTTDKPNRNSNINLVCKTIDGLVLQPGESFNFNEFIGPRTAAKGYKEAPGIYEGALRLELGGGICQTTGTLFHSVMMADLQIDERNPHTWPSDYVETGTDATVTWDGKNFQFTNNTEYPIAIHSFYKDRHITMEIYGRPVDDKMTIKIEGAVTGRSNPGAPVYVANPSAPVGSKTTVKSAHDYISAKCYKVYYKDGVEVKRELAFTSTYPAIRAEISVGVKAADGSIASLDPATGTVSGGTSETPAPSTEPASPGTPPTGSGSTPSDTTPATSAPAPSDTADGN
jgi:vancomycin resistance protein YoaR